MILEKRQIPALAPTLRVDSFGLALQRTLFSPFIRAANYHQVPPLHASAFEAHLLFFKEHFDILGSAALEESLGSRCVSTRSVFILTYGIRRTK